MSVSPDLIISSDATGWDNISLAHYRQAAGSLPQHCSLHHEICINFGKPVVVEQVIDGRSEIIHSVPNQLGLYPANISQSFTWDTEAESLILYLNVVDEVVFVTDMEAASAAAVFKYRREIFSGNPVVASTIVEISRLAFPELMVEIKCVAKI